MTIKRFKSGQPLQNKSKSGRPKDATDKCLERRVLQTLKVKRSMSVRDIAKKCNTRKYMMNKKKK